MRFETVEIVVVRGVETIAARFHPPERITGIRSLGSGNVNDTYLVTHADRGHGAFVLQRLNTRVFHRPDPVMRNLEALGSHVQRRLANPPPELAGRRWEIPQVVPCRQQSTWSSTTESSGGRSLTSVQPPAQT